jgi:hypothetical protein
MNVEIIGQGLGTSNPFQFFLLRLLRDQSITRCSALVAFVTLDGLLRLGAEPGGALESFVLAPSKELHWIVGAESITSADALLRLRDLESMSGGRCSVLVSADPVGGLFHPKVFMFERPGGGGAVLIGSNNVTSGGLEENIEASVLLDNMSPKEMEPWRQVWLRAMALGHRLCPITNDLISEVREERRRQRRARRPRRAREEIEPELVQGNPRILIRYVARAGGRTSQVHFSRRIVEQFFGLRPGDGGTIDIQMVQPGQPPGRLEAGRRLVFSQTNRNPKIEMEGVRRSLPPDYPAGGYAILLVQEVERGRYRYMILLPTDPGYTALNNHLSQVPRHGLALREDIVHLDKLVEIWADYPV